MTKPHVITKSDTKRITAAALSEAKARNGWSNADAGDTLGISEGTVRNRLADDEPDKHHMTVYELTRAIAAGELALANKILGDLVGHHVAPNAGVIDAATALDAAGAAASCAAELIAAAADGKIDADEARELLPRIVKLIATMTGLEARVRDIVAASPVRRLHG